MDDAWTALARVLQDVGIRAQVKTIRDRFNMLIKKFKAEELDSLRKSGTTEEYDERKQLLTDICELMQHQKDEAKQKKALRSADDEKAKRIREAAMLTLRGKKRGNLKQQEPEVDANSSDREETDRTDETTIRKKVSLVSVMKSKEERRAESERSRTEMEKRRIALEEEKLRFKERKYEADMKLREDQMKADAKQRDEDRKLHAEQFQMQLKALLEFTKTVVQPK